MNFSFSIFGTGRLKFFKDRSSLAKICSRSQRLDSMQASPVSSHHHLHKSPGQPCHLLPHPHQTVKLHYCFLLLHCFHYISEEEDSLGTQACTCAGSLYANILCKSCRKSLLVHFTLCYDSCKQVTNVVDVCLPIMVFLHTFNPYIIILDQTKSNNRILE